MESGTTPRSEEVPDTAKAGIIKLGTEQNIDIVLNALNSNGGATTAEELEELIDQLGKESVARREIRCAPLPYIRATPGVKIKESLQELVDLDEAIPGDVMTPEDRLAAGSLIQAIKLAEAEGQPTDESWGSL